MIAEHFLDGCSYTEEHVGTHMLYTLLCYISGSSYQSSLHARNNSAVSTVVVVAQPAVVSSGPMTVSMEARGR